MAAKKGTRVTQREAEMMWELYQKCGSYTQVAEIMRRDPATVSRHVAIYKASANAVASLLLSSKG